MLHHGVTNEIFLSFPAVFGTLSPLVIRFLNAKRTLVIAFVCHLLYTLSNFYPTFPTLLTSSLLLGVAAGPMWTAQGLYCTATGLAYAGIKQVSVTSNNVDFRGRFEITVLTASVSVNTALLTREMRISPIVDMFPSV